MTAPTARTLRPLDTKRDISHEEKYRKSSAGRPPCSYCGARADRKLDIKVSWFRGDDERAFACNDCYRRMPSGY